MTCRVRRGRTSHPAQCGEEWKMTRRLEVQRLRDWEGGDAINRNREVRGSSFRASR